MRRRPCPFCGSATHMTAENRQSPEGVDNWHVVCDALVGGCGGSSGSHRTEAHAWLAWNERRSVEKLQRVLEVYAEYGTLIVQRVPTEDGATYEAFVRDDASNLVGKAEDMIGAVLALQGQLK